MIALKRTLEIAVSAVFWAAESAAAWIGNRAGRPRPQALTIIYYHAVSARAAPQFRRQMALLARSARIVAADWQGETSEHPDRPAVAITFDDALNSVLDIALPILAEFGFPCTIFVPTGCTGMVPAWRSEGAPHKEAVAAMERLAAASGAMVALGSHTKTHPHLSTLTAEAIESEVGDSRQLLQAVTGQDTRLLAFPYGDYDARTIAACGRAGYRHVFSIEPRVLDPARGDFVRGRIAVDAEDGLLAFYLKSAGAYRWMVTASALKRKLLTHAG